MSNEQAEKEYPMVPIGIHDFSLLRSNNYCYIDKTLLIKKIQNHGALVTLLARPRRFGKTINMSMLATFFDCQLPSQAHLF